MHISSGIIGCALVFSLCSEGFSQVQAVEKGSAEAARRIDANNRRAALDRQHEGPYHDDLAAFWEVQSFDLSADPAEEYLRLAKLFQERRKVSAEAKVDSARERLQALKRGRISRAAESSVVESGGRYTFNHGDAKAKAVGEQEKLLAAYERKLAELENTKTTPHIPMSGAIRGEGTVFFVGNLYESGRLAQILQVIDGENMAVTYQPIIGEPTTYWVAGHPTNGLADKGAVILDGVYRVAGTKAHESATGRRTVRILQRIEVDATKYRSP